VYSVLGPGAAGDRGGIGRSLLLYFHAVLLESLNPTQLDAVEHTEGPLLILAGAGSGKTRVLTHRVAYLIDQGLAAPEEVLAITFTNKAAREMKDRVALLVGPDSRKMWVSTFHAFCARILRVHAEKLGYRREFTIYDGADQVRLVKRCIVELGKDPKRFNPRSFQAQISSAKNVLMAPDDFLRNTEGYIAENVAEVYDLYQRRLYENNAMDFDDLIMQTVALLELFPEVRERYQTRFKYIHVDEYQDTNHAQYRLVNILAAAHRNLCVVGDDDQSVYSWRGADIRNILDFERDYPEAKVVKLEQNYRSTQTILDAANAVVANNASRKAKALWTAGGEGERIRVFAASDEYAEARFVVSEVEQLIEGGASPREISVFYRTNAQSRALEDVLVREGVPYQVVGGVRFYERAEIKDAMAYLSVISNPDDSVSLERIINVPKRGLGDTSVAKLQDYARRNGLSLYGALSETDAAGLTGAAKKACRGVRDLFEGLRVAAREVPPAELIGAVLDESGYRKELEAEDTVEAESRLENLEELINAAREYERVELEPTLEGFLQEQALYSDQDSLTSEGGRVTLMTFHNAPVRSTNTTSKRNGGSPTSASRAPGRRSRLRTPSCAPVGASASTGCHLASSPRSRTSTSRARCLLLRTPQAAGDGAWLCPGVEGQRGQPQEGRHTRPGRRSGTPNSGSGRSWRPESGRW
jgi:DNA helicase II / ATP-dependent DNA helicase PcrA